MLFQPHMNLECIPEIKAERPHAHDNIILADASGLAERCDLGSYRTGLLQGDLSLVALSDQYLEKLEDSLITSRTWHNVSSCVGALPIIPAYIAGQSNNMRLRTRQKKPAGPLSIFMECTGSAGSMGAGAVQRGSAMLALVRKLNEYRPVELWLCVTYGHHNQMNGLLTKIETTPLDLGRAAHMLCRFNETAGQGWNILRRVVGDPGSWSYGEPRLERTWCGEIFARFLHPGSDVLYIPAAYLADKLLSNPTAWLQDMLVKYGGETVERDDDDEREREEQEKLEGRGI